MCIRDRLNIDGVVDLNKLHEIGINWSDAVGICTENVADNLSQLITSSDKPVLAYHSEEQTIEVHQDFYEKVLSENGVLA